MSNLVRTLLQEDPYYLAQKRKELQNYLDIFRKQLFKVYVIMPPPTRVLYLETGEWELINDSKWQQIIDNILKMQKEFLKNNFSEWQ